MDRSCAASSSVKQNIIDAMHESSLK